MGIQGLLPFLQKSTKKVNISQYAGSTVAVDAYCWLHKGAFSCAEKLARGEPTDMYVQYCLKFVNMLLSNNIKPILVFDGRHLPAKKDTEKKRREARESNRKKAAELLKQDRGEEARQILRRSVDVTHDMALALIKQCRSRNVDCIVAPYEADAQLAYLNISGIAHIVITEDSDLLLFGCKMVLFKMDVQGNGLLIEQDLIPISMKVRPEQFSMDKFRHMCILSGCDYLPSLPGIGLSKACKFIKRTAETDMNKALQRLPSYLNMPSLEVSPDYKDKFIDADLMFKHQPVFDPISKKVVPLTPLPPGCCLKIPEPLDPETALQLAYGNLEPFTLKTVDNWDPSHEADNMRSGSSGFKALRASHKSMWSPEFKLPRSLPPKSDPREVVRSSTVGQKVMKPVDELTSRLKSMAKRSPPKVPKPSTEEELESLRTLYNVSSPPSKKVCLDSSTPPKMDIGESMPSPITREELPSRRFNPFAKKTESSKPSGMLSKLAKRKQTVIDESCVVRSRYFSNSQEEPLPTKPLSEDFIPLTPEEPGDKPIVSPSKNMFAVSEPKKSSSFSSNFSSPTEGKGSLIGAIDCMNKAIEPSEKSSLSQSNFKWTTSLAKLAGVTKTPSLSKTNLSELVELDLDELIDEVEGNPTPPASQGSPPSSSQTLTQSKKNSTLNKSLMTTAKRVGLSKKKTPKKLPDPNQKSLLDMFAYKPKTKLST